MLHRRSAVALALVLALGGCTAQGTGGTDSSSKFQGEPRVVAKTIEDFESAATKGNKDAICSDFLTPALVASYRQHAGTCAKGVDDAIKDTDAFGITVKSVRITGNRAAANVTVDIGDKDRRQSMSLTRQGQIWKISSFS
jgi:hypothetical protein